MRTGMKVGVAALVGAALVGGGGVIAGAVGVGRTGTSTAAQYSGSMMGNTVNGFGMMGTGGAGSRAPGWGMMEPGMMGLGMTRSGMMGWWQGSSSALPATIPGRRQVAVTADDRAFTPAVLTMATGESVNLDVHNADSVVHDLTIPGLGIHAVIEPGQDVVFGLRPTVAGTYPFLCTMPGHAAAGMRGVLTVSS